MASQKYFCFKCRDNGFPNEEITFAGKDEQGKTIYKNATDMTPHQHKEKQQQQQQQSQQQDKQIVSMYEQIPVIIQRLESLEGKIDYLTRLVCAMSTVMNVKEKPSQRRLR